MALDEPNAEDERIDVEGIPLALGRELRLWLNGGRAVLVRYDGDIDTFFVRLSGPACC